VLDNSEIGAMFGGVHPSTVSKVSVRFEAELARVEDYQSFSSTHCQMPGPDTLYIISISKISFIFEGADALIDEYLAYKADMYSGYE